MSKNELNFEDLTFREDQNEPDYLELPLSRQTFLLAVAAVLLVGLITIGRTSFLGFIKGDFYRARALANANKEIDVPAPRGIILDRFGEPLVENKSSFSVFLGVNDLLRSPEALSKTINSLSDILAIDRPDLEEIVRKADLEKKNFVPIARNISVAQAINLRGLNSPAVQVEDDYVRDYSGAVFSHVLGYVGASENNQDIVGKTGLELEYDGLIRGKDGRLIIYRDAAGKILDQKIAAAPVIGNDLKTTIDADLQRYFYNRFKNALFSLGRDTGVGIALNPQNGEVLSLISLPSFNSDQVAKFLKNPRQPLFNRAISGAYNPGSAIKPLVALAALREKIVDPKFQILSTGSIELPNPYDPEKPSRFLDWKAHGWVDLHSALARSSNVYFYEVGGGFGGLKGLGIERLRQYWGKFLLGVKTGIDLPAENTGFLPDPEEKEERTGQIWRIGDTYNVSIGQGDLLVTPIQLLSFIASIANGGKIYRPHLVSNYQNEVSLDYSAWQEEIKEVRIGMEDAVKKYYGTANLLSSLPMPAAGKTGSVQVANNTRTNAFFVGYAPASAEASAGKPAEIPQIAILVLIENAKEGSLNAVPIAKDVLEWYYYNRLTKGL